MEMNNGEIIEGQNTIKFENVPIYTPNGDLLIAQINLEVWMALSLNIIFKAYTWYALYSYRT